MREDQRLEAFEAMLQRLQADYGAEQQTMERLKAEGKEKSATYRQYLGNRMLYQRMFALYRQFGLLER